MKVLAAKHDVSDLEIQEHGEGAVLHAVQKDLVSLLAGEMLSSGAVQIRDHKNPITGTRTYVARVAVGDPSLIDASPGARDRAELGRIFDSIQTETAQQQMEAELKQQLWDKLNQTATMQAVRTRTPPAPPPPVPSSIRGSRADMLIVDDVHDDRADALRRDPAAFTRQILEQGWPEWAAGSAAAPTGTKPRAPDAAQLPRAEVQKLRDYVKELEPKILGETSGQYVAGLILSRIDAMLESEQ
jgi:hypothetical protein